MSVLRRAKLRTPDGTESIEYPLGVDAENVKVANRENLSQRLARIDEDLEENEEDIAAVNEIAGTNRQNIGAAEIRIDALERRSASVNKKPYYFDTVADMKAYQGLIEGDMAITLGYYAINDGGGAKYKIVNGEYVDDGGSYHELGNSLFAELIIKNNEVNIKQFGCKENDNTYDNAININALLTFLYSKYNQGTIYIPSGIFYIQQGIYIRPNIKFIGWGETSIIKASTLWRNYNAIFYDYNGTSSDPYQHNVIFDNFCIDNNFDITDIPYGSSHAQICINMARGEHNCIISNMTFYTCGIWATHVYGNNNVFINNKYYFKQSHTSTFYDVSTLLIEGDNCTVENNNFYVLDNTTMNPNTAIEIHGNKHKIKYNYVENYLVGIITIPNQLDWNSPNGTDNIVSHNTLIPIKEGISIWSGTKGICARNTYSYNKIYLKYDIGQRGINLFYSISDNLVSIKDLTINNNEIIFMNRHTANVAMLSADVGIMSWNVTDIENFNIMDNIISNCGGYGIALHLFQEQGGELGRRGRGVNIFRNTFRETRIPIRLGLNYEQVLISENIFEQKQSYESGNMLRVFHRETFAKNYTLKNNYINTYSALKPYYPTLDMGDLGRNVMFRRTDNVVLERNTVDESMPLFYIDNTYDKKAVTLEKDCYYILNDVKKKAFYTTLGNLKTAQGDDVTITSWISNSCVEVNDASNIYPETFLTLNSSKFKKTYVYIIAVWGNKIYCSSENIIVDFSLKDGITGEDVVGEVLHFYNYSTNL